MRHYDRTDFRHLNDGERYRDYDYVAEDGWAGSPEEGRRPEVPKPGPSPRHASAEGQGPPAPRRMRDRLLGVILHPTQALVRAARLVGGLIEWAKVVRQR